MKVQIHFKNPDAIFDLTVARNSMPDDELDITPRMEQARDDFMDEYFEYGDYGVVEIDTETLNARLLPRREWKP